MKYELTDEDIGVSHFGFQQEFIRYGDILSLILSNMKIDDVAKKTLFPRNPLLILRIYITINRNQNHEFDRI